MELDRQKRVGNVGKLETVFADEARHALFGGFEHLAVDDARSFAAGYLDDEPGNIYCRCGERGEIAHLLIRRHFPDGRPHAIHQRIDRRIVELALVCRRLFGPELTALGSDLRALLLHDGYGVELLLEGFA